MILSGSSRVFAIAAEITQCPKDWILGRFRFVFHGRSCGNWEDETDLRGCYGWLKDFSEKARNRYEVELLDLAPETVFERLVQPVMNRSNEIRIPEYYPETFSRFHIAHLGMSSFDRVSMVLIEGADQQRCVWEDAEDWDIHDDVFPSGHMQLVAASFCRQFEMEVATLGGEV